MKKNVIISTAPSSLTGGALIHTDYLLQLKRFLKCEVYFIGFEKPKDYSDSIGINYIFPQLNSENASYISNSLLQQSIIEVIVNKAIDYKNKGYGVILLSSFLYPFTSIIFCAKSILLKKKISTCIITIPTGSDIWKISKSLQHSTKYYLENSNFVFSYSRTFASEIRKDFLFKKKINIIPPFIDTEKFKIKSDTLVAELKKKHNVQVDLLVLSNISNMRYIKGLVHTVKIAKEISERQPTLLILVGPLTNALNDILKTIPLDKINSSSEYTEFSSGDLLIRKYKETLDIVEFHQISDFAINTSYHDTFNKSLAEALSCGTPIITSSCVGLLEYMKNCLEIVISFNFLKKIDIINQKIGEIDASELQNLVNDVLSVFHNKSYSKNISIKCNDFILDNFSQKCQLKYYKSIIEPISSL